MLHVTCPLARATALHMTHQAHRHQHRTLQRRNMAMAHWPQIDTSHTSPYRPHVALPPPKRLRPPTLRPPAPTYGPAPSPTHGRQRHLAHKPHRGLASSPMPTSHARTWPVKKGPPATRGPCQLYMAHLPHTDLASYICPTSHTRPRATAVHQPNRPPHSHTEASPATRGPGKPRQAHQPHTTDLANHTPGTNSHTHLLAKLSPHTDQASHTQAGQPAPHHAACVCCSQTGGRLVV